MKAEPLKAVNGGTGHERCEPSEATHVRLKLPGPYPTRIIPVTIGGTRRGTPNWTWNGDVDKPTLKPSVLTSGGKESPEMPRCHTWITDGKVRFLDDCTHKLASQTLDLLDIDE